MNYEQELQLMIDRIDRLVTDEHVGGYELVRMMPNQLLNEIESGLYAFSQELDNKTSCFD